MPKIGDMFPSKWIKAEDLMDKDGDSEDLTLTIDTSLQEEIGPEREPKLVIYFLEKVKDHEKALILNKTNIGTLVKLFGDDTDDWEGQKITLYVTEATFKGETCNALRIKSKAPKDKTKSKVQPVNQEEHDSDAPPF